MDLTTTLVQRPKEPQPLQMVHVQVGQQQVDTPSIRECTVPGEPQPRSCIQQKPVPFFTREFHAGGIAAITNRIRTRRRQTSPRSQEVDLHYTVTGYNNAITPSVS